MNGKGGGFCKAKYGGGGGGGGGGEGMYGMSKLDRIMLKFRPIAPKPVPAGSGSGGGSTSDRFVKSVRSKRKYVRVNKNKKDNSKRLQSGEQLTVEATSSPPPVVTLPLLPETPDRKKNDTVVTTRFSDLLSTTHSTKCSYNNNNYYYYNNYHDMTSAPAPARLSFGNQVRAPPQQRRLPPQVVSYVSVENVTGTWEDSEMLLGCTDKEIMTNMMNDTCPWFVSDGQDTVVWTNKAYRQIAGAGNLIDEGEMAVVLIGKHEWMRTPAVTSYPCFSCKVKVTFRAAHSHRKTPSPTLTLPCDGWRMERGTCAWRLDVKAALSLGR